MPTTYLRVPAGSTSAAIALTPNQNLIVGPALLGGSVLVETSDDGLTSWTRWSPGTITQGGSVRLAKNGYARVTATTQAASVFVADFSLAAGPLKDALLNVNAPLASASATTEQVLLSWRTPAGLLPANFSMSVNMGLVLTNNANVKTLRLRAGGVGGTALYTSPSLASALNHNCLMTVAGRGDGVSLIGLSAGASGGWGNSTTAYPTATLDYLNNETEWVITITKATGTDTGQLESALVSLY